MSHHFRSAMYKISDHLIFVYRVYICQYICIYTCTQTYIHTHTYAHTHTSSFRWSYQICVWQNIRLIFTAFLTSRGTQRTEYNELQRTACALLGYNAVNSGNNSEESSSWLLRSGSLKSRNELQSFVTFHKYLLMWIICLFSVMTGFENSAWN